MKGEQLECEFVYCGARIAVYQTYITLAGRKIFKHLMTPGVRHAVAAEEGRRRREAQEIQQDTARAPLVK